MDSVAFGVVIEVDVNFLAFCCIGGEAFGPEGEFFVGEADAVGAVVEAEVAERPDGWNVEGSG